MAALKRTPLFDLHVKLGAKMVPFAGYEMPLQYRGIVAEHLHARKAAVLFDVSHMGQVRIDRDPLEVLETVLVADVAALGAGRMRYTMMLNDDGGIVDDLLLTHWGSYVMLVVNASRKEVDLQYLRSRLGDEARVELLQDAAMLALQGPAAATVLARLAPASRLLPFMTAEPLKLGDIRCVVCRSGYTGEDGFEICCGANEAPLLADLLLAEPEVAAAGLGARDTLRLEAGLCLWGNDIDETTTPVEAGLSWTISRRRREAADFPGHTAVLRQLAEGPARKRVGIRLEGRVPVRHGAQILSATGVPVGQVTSGGYAPSLAAPVAMGYVDRAQAAVGTQLLLVVRDKPLPGIVTPLPFVEHRYVK